MIKFPHPKMRPVFPDSHINEREGHSGVKAPKPYKNNDNTFLKKTQKKGNRRLR